MQNVSAVRLPQSTVSNAALVISCTRLATNALNSALKATSIILSSLLIIMYVLNALQAAKPVWDQL